MRGRQIGLVIEEVLKTGIPPENIVVVDGHSSDGTDEVARKMGVYVVYQDGDGKADAVKKGLSLVKTRYVAIIDDD